jgi:hypothetical protein
VYLTGWSSSVNFSILFVLGHAFVTVYAILLENQQTLIRSKWSIRHDTINKQTECHEHILRNKFLDWPLRLIRMVSVRNPRSSLRNLPVTWSWNSASRLYFVAPWDDTHCLIDPSGIQEPEDPEYALFNLLFQPRCSGDQHFRNSVADGFVDWTTIWLSCWKWRLGC